MTDVQTTEEEMSYKSIVEMAQSQTLLSRIVACAARENIDSPNEWVMSRAWKFASTTGWDTDWAYAVDTANVNVNPNTGERDDVISDADILTRVQAIRTTEAGGV